MDKLSAKSELPAANTSGDVSHTWLSHTMRCVPWPVFFICGLMFALCFLGFHPLYFIFPSWVLPATFFSSPQHSCAWQCVSHFTVSIHFGTSYAKQCLSLNCGVVYKLCREKGK